jgi:pilus assembly protein FimV
MVRKSAVALAIMGLVASRNSFALGLGNVEMKSALNQPLRAEIELLSATDNELQELKAGIAPKEAFSRAGIDWRPYLGDLSFNVERLPDGRAVVKITSRQGIHDPFLEFLIEVSWSKGRLVREYTVLVDPPVTMPGSPAMTRGGFSHTEPAPVAAGSTAPATVTSPLTAPAPAPAYSGGEQYGAVRRNETLWSIAEKVRPDGGVTMEQMMLALLRTNPEAFDNHNINELREGYVLRIPDRNEIESISRADALSESRRQYREWRETQPDAESPASAAASSPQAEAKLQLMAPDVEETDGDATPGEPDTSDETRGGEAEMREQLALANETIEAEYSHSLELESRVSELQAQLAEMKRLLDIRDGELARLQARLGADSDPDAEAREQASMTVGADAESPAGSMDPDPTMAARNAAVDPRVRPDEQGAPAEPVKEPAAPEAAADAASRDSLTAKPGILQRLTENALMTGLGAVVLLVFGGLIGVARSRRRRDDEDYFMDEMDQEGGMDSMPQPEQMHSPATVAAGYSAMMSDLPANEYSAEGGGESQTDPLTEADVYLAYGRYQQAEDLVREALASDPDNNDLKLKLLEVFHASRDVTAFENMAASVRLELQGEDDPLWQRIAELGRELDPASSLYGAQVSASGAPPAEDEGLDFDMHLAGTPGDEAEEPVGTTGSDDEFDGDLSFGALDLKGDAGPSNEAGAPEFTLDDFDFQSDGDESQDEGEGLLEPEDEVSTKLDLARAYLDMGDPEGARNILEEVMEEGNDRQKDEARTLAEQLS